MQQMGLETTTVPNLTRSYCYPSARSFSIPLPFPNSDARKQRENTVFKVRSPRAWIVSHIPSRTTRNSGSGCHALSNRAKKHTTTLMYHVDRLLHATSGLMLQAGEIRYSDGVGR